MQIKKRKGYTRKLLYFTIFPIFTLLVIVYLPCDIYNFQPPKKFSGNYLYNPYQDLSPVWQQSNFHAHARAWGGLTNGKLQAGNILNLYKDKGYSFACVSNYESVVPEDEGPNSVAVYEHGYNISKTHQLVIMPQQVCFNDFPLFQWTSSKQRVLNKLSSGAKAVVMAHPSVRNGYNDDDVKNLSGYNLMEVLNDAANGSKKWDLALSTGKPVWIIGDDDTHDAADTTQTFMNWTMINSREHNKDSVVDHLIDGNAYAVHGENAFNDNLLTACKVHDMNVSILLQNKADSIQLIGQNGIIKKVVFDTDSANYTFNNNDSYIRAVAYNKLSTMYLNPVIRYNGTIKPHNILTATINVTDTFLYRNMLVLAWFGLVLLFNPKFARQILKLLRRRNVAREKAPSLTVD